MTTRIYQPAPIACVSAVTMPPAVRDRQIDAALAAAAQTAPQPPTEAAQPPTEAAQPPTEAAQPAPALVDTYSTDPDKSDVARVVSATVDPRTGRNNSYNLSYCWALPTTLADGTPAKGRFQVNGCGCLAFLRNHACRHTIGLFDLLNISAVAAYLLPVPLPGYRPACVLGACRAGACGACGGERWQATMYVPPSLAREHCGHIAVTACASCKKVIV